MSAQETGTLIATLGIQLQLTGSVLCLALGLTLRRGMGGRPWLTWWTMSFGAVALAVAALLVRYSLIPIEPLAALPGDQSTLVAGLHAAYAGGKLLFLCCLLAGTWLTSIRWFGIAAGLGFVILPVGLILGGVDHPLTYAGGVGYSIVFPVWAFLMGRHLSTS